MPTSRLLLSSLLLVSACGGAEDDLAHDDAELAEQALEDAELSQFPPIDEGERRFDAALMERASLRPLVSRVALVAGTDCPTRITDDLAVPFRCLEVRSGRHAVIDDVDVLDPETLVHFHFMDASLDARTRSAASLSDCPVTRQPNGFADGHAAGVRKFVATGWRRQDGQRRYDVLYRRVGDTYKLLPARPRLDLLLWTFVKPAAGMCVPLGQ